MKIFDLLDVQYKNFTDAIKIYLSKTLDSNKFKAYFGNNTVFGQIINVMSAIAHNIMLYIEDAFVEQNKYTAQRKKSIYGLASLSGYEPSSGKAAGAQIKLSFKPSNESPFNIVLPNHTQFICTQNGLTYNLILPQEAVILSIDKDNSSKYFYVVQGKFEIQSFVATGGKYYTQNFKYNSNLDMDYVTVKVNNKTWNRVASLYDMEPNSEEYVLKTNYEGGMDIIFGNDVHGRSMQDGDKILVEYLIHDGEIGNLDNLEETYFVFQDMLTNIAEESINGNHIFNVTLTSKDAITAGTNSEMTNDVRKMIGYNSRSLVLAAPENYKSFINKFSFCGYNRTWNEPGKMIVNSLIIKNYTQHIIQGKDYFKLNENDFILTDLQKESIKNSIKQSGNQLAGVSYNIYDPEICKYSLYLYIKLKNESKEVGFLKNKIENLVGQFFSNIQSDIYIPKSDIIHLIKNNVPEVDGVTAYFLSERNENALKTKSYIDENGNTVHLYDGENPNLGLDAHNNIYLQSDRQFPVLMGGWQFESDMNYVTKSDNQLIDAQPLIITFE